MSLLNKYFFSNFPLDGEINQKSVGVVTRLAYVLFMKQSDSHQDILEEKDHSPERICKYYLYHFY